MSERTFRPVLSAADIKIILDAVDVAVEASLDYAAKTKDPLVAQSALAGRAWAFEFHDRMDRMTRKQAGSTAVADGQMTVDEAMAELDKALADIEAEQQPVDIATRAIDDFEARKAQAEAEERADAIVDHYKVDDFVESVTTPV